MSQKNQLRHKIAFLACKSSSSEETLPQQRAECKLAKIGGIVLGKPPQLLLFLMLSLSGRGINPSPPTPDRRSRCRTPAPEWQPNAPSPLSHANPLHRDAPKSSHP